MIEWVKNFFTNETSFVRVFRGIAAGGALVLDKVADLPPWVTPTVLGVALMFGAGDKNPEPSVEE